MNGSVKIQINNEHSGQIKVLSEAKRFNVLDCGRRWGKSSLAVNLLCEPALDGHPVAYFAPFYKLLEGTYKELYSVLNTVTSKKHENQFIELVTGGSIEFWSLENPLAGRSRKYKVAIIDEAAFNRNLWQSWTEAIRPTLTDLKGSAWFMSTPKGKNDFYKLWMRGQTGEPDWMSWQMPTITNPFIDAAEIESARRDLPELAFKQEYLAEFNDNVANPFGLDYIRICTGQMSNEPAVCFGIDLAKSFDWTVIIGLDKFGTVCHFDRFQRPWNETNHPFSRSLDRISSTKGYTPDNVRWVCFKYNSWKSDLTLNDVSLIFKYMSKSAGYDPIEYMREVEKGNPNPHLVLENNP